MVRRSMWGVLGACVAVLLLGGGCSTTYGRFVPNSQFAYPNSNITQLGPVKAEKSKTWIFFTPTLNIDDIKEVYNNALSQQSGANILTNFHEDTKFTQWVILPLYTIKYTIHGDAARMVVGDQKLD